MSLLIGLDMFGHIDDVFTSVTATRIAKSGGERVDGKWVPGVDTSTTHVVNVQPLNDKEVQHLNIGGDRIKDYRKIYVNDGTAGEIIEADNWTFPGVDGTFKTYMLEIARKIAEIEGIELYELGSKEMLFVSCDSDVGPDYLEYNPFDWSILGPLMVKYGVLRPAHSFVIIIHSHGVARVDVDDLPQAILECIIKAN